MASFGEELKRERELRDISLKEISEATKISIRFLEALEQNNFDILPGGIFNRGFIRAYARFIGIDGEEMVNAYLHEVGVREARQTQRSAAAPARPSATAISPPQTATDAVVRPDRGSPVRIGPGSSRHGLEKKTSLTLWIVAAIVLVIGVVVVLMSLMGSGGMAAGTDAATTAHPAPPRQVLAGLVESQQPANPIPGTSQADANTPETTGVAETSPDAAPPPTGDQDRMTADPEAAQEGDPNIPAVPRHRVRVLAMETTVVMIRCADAVVLDQELWPGQSRTVTCEEPVALGADNAGAVQYSIDGAASILLGGLGVKVDALVVAPPPGPTASPGSGGARAED